MFKRNVLIVKYPNIQRISALFGEVLKQQKCHLNKNYSPGTIKGIPNQNRYSSHIIIIVWVMFLNWNMNGTFSSSHYPSLSHLSYGYCCLQATRTKRRNFQQGIIYPIPSFSFSPTASQGHVLHVSKGHRKASDAEYSTILMTNHLIVKKTQPKYFRRCWQFAKLNATEFQVHTSISHIIFMVKKLRKYYYYWQSVAKLPTCCLRSLLSTG